MTKRTSLPADEALLAIVQQIVQQALEDGCNRAELGRALTAVAVQFRLESRRNRRSSNLAAQRQRSSTSPDASALRAAFRRCHSDVDFRTRFIANYRDPTKY